MGLAENARGSFAEEDHLGRLVFASANDERHIAPGDTNDSQPHPEGDLPAVVPDWSILEQQEAIVHIKPDDN